MYTMELHELLQPIHDHTMKYLPDSIQARSIVNDPLASLVGSYLVCQGVHWLSRKFTSPGFSEKWLPRIETAGIATAVLAAGAYGYYDPKAFQTYLQAHPVASYSAAALLAGYGLGIAKPILKPLNHGQKMGE
jgi:hypothetical protein